MPFGRVAACRPDCEQEKALAADDSRPHKNALKKQKNADRVFASIPIAAPKILKNG
ncbi:hypothetical protein [Ferrovibrio sp.]|uniref:hypothetical protein n=1 Tax=Ferrovibrio sp. TaxID=1917215 RepID=UPI001B72179C|nr:hypothetical protein [Ferrovibrio sp.]MBP7063816.1 hypothetical protein [Ferrovibrio sp.]